jgi:hypothetical protein
MIRIGWKERGIKRIRERKGVVKTGEIREALQDALLKELDDSEV